MKTLTVEGHRVKSVEREQSAVSEKDVLHRAADLLEEFGWCQRNYGSIERGAFCAAGAVGQALVDLDISYRRVPGDGDLGLSWLYDTQHWWAEAGGASWNDAPDRTKEEVVRALREAAERV